MSTQKSAYFVFKDLRSLISFSFNIAYLNELSQPTIVMSSPESKTIFAASGSTHMLYSAAAETFPVPSEVPPIM